MDSQNFSLPSHAVCPHCREQTFVCETIVVCQHCQKHFEILHDALGLYCDYLPRYVKDFEYRGLCPNCHHLYEGRNETPSCENCNYKMEFFNNANGYLDNKIVVTIKPW